MADKPERSKATKFPLDFDALEKGTWIEGEALLTAITVKRDHPMWSLKLHSLCEHIHDERGDLCVRVDHDRIRIMTDEEASEYGWRRLRHHVRGISRTRQRIARIDANQLSPEQRTLHEHRLRAAIGVSTATRMAMRKESRILALLTPTSQADEDKDED